VHAGRIALVQVSEVADLVGPEGTTNAGVLRPAVHTRLVEDAIDDQLTAAMEELEQTLFAVGSVERIDLLDGNPRHPPSLGSQRVTGAGQLFLLDE
jgi:hypothetical protein